ncbi:MAG: hypothetical protein AAGG75_17135 [Bacteroidota bacterium]
MKDNLEKFIADNRQEFDSDIPSLKVWAQIDKQLDHRKPKNKRLTLWKLAGIAAAVAVLLTVGAAIGFQMNDGAGAMVADSELATEIDEMERYYKEQINQKAARLASLNYEGKGAVNADLEQLATLFDELKMELANSPKGAEEQIINAMINNYQIRIDILEKVLNNIESTNQKTIKSNNDETTSI